MAKRGRKPGFKLAWRTMTSEADNTWYQDFRNLIHYARYYGNLTEIKIENLEKERETERIWMAEKKQMVDDLRRIRDIASEKDEILPIHVIDDCSLRATKEYNDSLDWFKFLNSCIGEYKKWENGRTIQQQASS